MDKSEKIEFFYMKQANKTLAVAMIIMGFVLLAISLIFVRGGGAAVCILMSCLGAFMLYKSRKPLVQLYSDYIETPVFKRFFTDIETIEKKKYVYTFHFKDGSKKALGVNIFDKEPMERLTVFLDNLKSQKDNNNEK